MMNTALPSGYKRNPNLHAYLFVSGDAGARHDAAKILSMSMLCRNRQPDGTPCKECDCCVKVNAGTHPDCINVSGSEKTGVDDVRKIEDEAYLAPNEADSKVFILEDADEYNVHCQNALLKIVEEPPKGVKFVLTASSVGAILPTVRSRVCTLSGTVRDVKSLAEEIKKTSPQIPDDKVNILSHFAASYDKADIKSLDVEQLCGYVEKAHLFLSCKDTGVIMSLPKKREELMLYLQVFMLSSRQVALVKATGSFVEGILDRTRLSECNTKTSMKRAHTLYDVFEEGYILAEANANVNAVLSFLMENAK